MQINFYTLKSPLIKPYSKTKTSPFLNKNINTIQDSVNFTSAKIAGNASKKALEFGAELFEASKKGKLDDKTIKTIARKNIPIIETGTMRELFAILGEDALYCKAYLLPLYSDNCKLKKLTIFSNKDESLIQRIGSISHEYCHALQRYGDDTYIGLAEYTNNDLSKTRVLNSIGANTFSPIERLKAKKDVIVNTVEYLNKGEDEQTALYRAFGLENEKEFRIFIKSNFNKLYSETLQMHIDDEKVKKLIPFLDDPMKLRRIVREQCAIRAKMEEEAYMVERDIIKKINEKELIDENIFNPVFYKALSRVFN